LISVRETERPKVKVN